MLIKALRNYLCGVTTPRCNSKDDDEPKEFMTLHVKLDISRYGWERSIVRLKKLLGPGLRHYTTDESGRVRASCCTVDSSKVISRIARSRIMALQWYEMGKCSDSLFMKEPKKQESTVQQKQGQQFPFPQHNYNSYYLPHNIYNTYNRGGRGYGGDGYGYGNHRLLPPY